MTDTIASELRDLSIGCYAACSVVNGVDGGVVKQVRLAEFFSGPGGLALGAHGAVGGPNADPELGGALDVRHAWAVDVDPDSCRTYQANVPGATHVMAEDVRDVVRHKLDYLPDFDGFAFGFPCNDFSTVGRHLGLGGEYGPLYQTGVEVLKRRQPDWFVAENVGGIRSANNGKAFEIILRDMRDAGYVVVPHYYRFENYGVPQSRHRVIVVGFKLEVAEHVGEFRPPAPTHGPGTELPYVTAGEALGRRYEPGVAHMERARMSPIVEERLAYINPGENAFTASLPPHLRLNVRGVTLSSIYKKLREDAPAYTVTGSGGGGTHMYHWAENRALTNRERARLQTFPDDFTFSGTRESVRKQIGMAVPVEGARAVFAAVFKTLLGIPYRSVASNLPGYMVESPTLH